MAKDLRIAMLLGIGLGTMPTWQFGSSAMPNAKPGLPGVPRSPTGSHGKSSAPAKADQSAIRVNITPANAVRLRITVDGSFALRDRANNKLLGRFERLKESTVAIDGRNLRIGKRTFHTPSLEIVPEASPAVWVGRHQYRGTVRLHRDGDGKLVAVNVVPMHRYLASVVNGEMPAKFREEARKAQTVVARTYARYRMRATRGFGLFDVYADSRGQRYLGYQYRAKNGRKLAGESAGGHRLVRNTAGLVCRYKGKLFSPYYSAVCGGATTAGGGVFGDAVPALKSVPCQWCKHAKRYRWTVRVSRAKLEAAIREILKPRKRRFGELRSIAEIAGQREAFQVADRAGRHRVSGKELRSALSLPSPRFGVRIDGGDVLFAGRGHGHGVGLCQHGAAGLAKAGKSFREILRYYYTGVELGREKTER